MSFQTPSTLDAVFANTMAGIEMAVTTNDFNFINFSWFYWPVDSTTKCNFEQLVKEAKDVLVSKASRPASQSSHDLSTP